MKSRQSIIEIFSSFLNLDSNSVSTWITDPRLRRNMQRALDQTPNQNPDQAEQTSTDRSSEGYWALYWHQVWQAGSHALATDHLAAYVQEVCYWTAKKITTQFPTQQPLADSFQNAIVALPRILKSFKPQFGASFKSYAERTFSNVIKDSLHRTQQISICSDWALLNKLSQKRLLEALQQVSIDGTKAMGYALAWRCYQELYSTEDTKSSRKLETPPPETLTAIAQLYNSQRSSQSIQTEATPALIEQWLLAIAKAVRAYQSPKVVSASTPLPGQETGELLDYLPTSDAPLIEDMILQEEIEQRQAQKAQLDTMLMSAIAQLDPPLQALLQTYYGQDLTQQEIAQKLDLKQYNISRMLTRIRKTLSQAIAKWAAEDLHLTLTPSVLEAMNQLLEEWLAEQMRGKPLA
jgi:RNA polymerase sigma factor (sigma-70 family)